MGRRGWLGCEMGESLAGKVVRGSAYSVSASVVTLILGFARAILLARLLAPSHFGVVALAMFYIGLISQLRALGLDQAVIHHQNSEETFLSTYFTLRIVTSVAALLLLAAVAPFLAWFYPRAPLFLWVLLALVGVEVVRAFTYTQESILRKELAFRQLAITDVVASVSMTVVAPLLAWFGFGVWALVAEQATGILMRFIMTWVVFPRWHPRFGWDKDIAKWFWRYGRSVWGAANLNFALDRFDDFWIGTFLGKTPLGYYSRAYEFARYPRRVVANPLSSVFMPVFARLQHDRSNLSRSFYRAAYIILRTGVLVAGAFALIMPEFIHLVIGDKWFPMLLAFRLMLIYTLLDSLLMLSGNLLLAVGRPQVLEKVLFVQAIFFIPAVILGARIWGINGVAVAADGMLVVGAVAMYFQLKRIVDFSLFQLVFWPVVLFLPSWACGLYLEVKWHPDSVWLLAGSKLLVFVVLYVVLLSVVERGDYIRGLRWVWRSVSTRDRRVGVW